MLKTIQNNNKIYFNTVMLARSKLNSVATLISRVLIDLKEEITIIKSQKIIMRKEMNEQYKGTGLDNIIKQNSGNI